MKAIKAFFIAIVGTIVVAVGWALGLTIADEGCEKFSKCKEKVKEKIKKIKNRKKNRF